MALVCPIQKIQLLVENHMVRFLDGRTVACNGQDDASSLNFLIFKATPAVETQQANTCSKPEVEAMW